MREEEVYTALVINGATQVGMLSWTRLSRRNLWENALTDFEDLWAPPHSTDGLANRALSNFAGWRGKIESSFTPHGGMMPGPETMTGIQDKPPIAPAGNALPAPVNAFPERQPGESQAILSNNEAPLPSDDNTRFLTNRVDTLVGSGGNNTFLGARGTVQSNDTLIGGSGFNVADLNLEITPSRVFARYDLSLEKIEHVDFTVGQANLVPVTLSAFAWRGVEQVGFAASDGSTEAIVSIEHLRINPTLKFSHFGGTIFSQYDLGNDTSTIALVLEDQTNLKLSLVPGGHVDRIDITSSGVGPNVAYIDILASDSLYPRELALFGNAPLEVSAADREFSHLMSIDARNLAGGLTMALNNSNPLSVQGGIGNDRMILTGSIGPISFDGNAGEDTIGVDIDQAFAALSNASIKAVEHLLVSGTLQGCTTIINAAGFEDIRLSGAIQTGATLRLTGFEQVVLDANVDGHLLVNSDTALTIKLQEGCTTLNTLDLPFTRDATIITDALPVSVHTLVYDSNTQAVLRFVGSARVSVENVHHSTEVGGIVDMTDLEGGFDNDLIGAEFAPGTDFMIGDFHQSSRIRLDSSPRGKSEVVFGDELHSTVTLFNVGLGDRVDLGRLGVSQMSELSIRFASGVSHITSSKFAGEIDIVGVDVTHQAAGSSLFDFNGQFG